MECIRLLIIFDITSSPTKLWRSSVPFAAQAKLHVLIGRYIYTFVPCAWSARAVKSNKQPLAIHGIYKNGTWFTIQIHPNYLCCCCCWCKTDARRGGMHHHVSMYVTSIAMKKQITLQTLKSCMKPCNCDFFHIFLHIHSASVFKTTTSDRCTTTTTIVLTSVRKFVGAHLPIYVMLGFTSTTTLYLFLECHAVYLSMLIEFLQP